MKIIIFILIFLTLNANSIKMNYVGELSIFGKIANGEMVYDNDGKEYSITITARGSGIVGKLTQNKKYVMQSIGLVKDGVLIPQKYINAEYAKDFQKIKIYKFDYVNNKTFVSESKKEKIEISKFNIIRMGYDISYKDIETNKKEVLDEIYQDDMISMFFNKKHNLLSMKENETKRLNALGSDDTQEGIIIKSIKHKNDKHVFSVAVEKDYLSGGAKDATFIFDDNNILYETRIDGILFFGNAVVRRIN